MPRIGETRCPSQYCGATEVVASRTAGGKLTVFCHKCQMDFWPREGFKGYRSILEHLKLDEDAQATPSKGKQLDPELPPGRIPEPKAKPRNLMDEL